MRDRRGKWRADDPDWLFHPSASCHSFCHALRMAVVWGRVTHPGHVAPPPPSPTVSITLTCASLDSRRNFWRTRKLHTESSQALETNPGHHSVAQDGYGTRTYRLLRCGNTVSFWTYGLFCYFLLLLNVVSLPILTSSKPFIFLFLFTH